MICDNTKIFRLLNVSVWTTLSNDIFSGCILRLINKKGQILVKQEDLNVVNHISILDLT